MEAHFNPSEDPHTRYNPLTGEWVLVSPHRTKRPWAGKVEKPAPGDGEIAVSNSASSQNPLCPGARRPNGECNPYYEGTFVFDNDFPAIMPDTASPADTGNELFRTGPAQGICRVMCFHPRSDMTLAKMNHKEIYLVIDAWIEQMIELGRKYSSVQIFENRGEIMGCSNPHPHCQIWATSYLPNEPSKKDQHQKIYYQKYQRPLLLDYLTQELEKRERIVIDSEFWVVLVSFWAVWPYETMVLPKRHVLRLQDLSADEKQGLATIMKDLLMRYDMLFDTSFPYSMGWHGAPTGTYLMQDNHHWQLHAVYYPPLLRSATVRKFMVGFEMLAGPQRDFTPEQAAQQLRSLVTLPGVE